MCIIYTCDKLEHVDWNMFKARFPNERMRLISDIARGACVYNTQTYRPKGQRTLHRNDSLTRPLHPEPEICLRGHASKYMP